MTTPSTRTPIAVVLAHYPVYNRRAEIVTTAITNLDLHDISRIARTYECDAFYAITPLEAQRDLAESICRHWAGDGTWVKDHPRAEALARMVVLPSIEDAAKSFEERFGIRPRIVVTGAALDNDITTFAALREDLARGAFPGVLLVFGTGWGLTSKITQAADVRLEPIRGLGDFNHLPVRAAVAIVLDRLLGSR